MYKRKKLFSRLLKELNPGIEKPHKDPVNRREVATRKLFITFLNHREDEGRK